MKEFCKNNLNEIKSLLLAINQIEYSKKLNILHEVNIGAHVRHILEFYHTVMFTKTKVISYDQRERNILLQNDKNLALEYIDQVLLKIDELKTDKKIVVQSEFGLLESSLYRELFYALEHSIHHQAIIKIGLSEIDKTKLVPKNFGVAPSTIAYHEKTNKECVL